MKISVIGASNIDICGRAASGFVPHDSNPGGVTVSLGGVGRNVSHNLRLLGQDVSFFTAIGGDEHAERIAKDCAMHGVDLSHALYRPDMRSSIYLCVNDAEGELVAGISDMPLSEAITVEYLERELGHINDADAVVFDTNLSAEAMEFLMARCVPPLFVDCVSRVKAERLKTALENGGSVFTLKANRYEAEVLSGVEVNGGEAALKAAKRMLSLGAERVFLTLGAEGVCCADAGGAFLLPALPTKVANAAGAGDAFIAALVCALGRGADLRLSADYGQKAAKIALESPAAVSENLSLAALEE
ncbi:MAG: carbohydrate kinase family protein [Clostridia bacterium]|nr:carbohydrate kinase family protein [Clostridia bacterium]